MDNGASVKRGPLHLQGPKRQALLTIATLLKHDTELKTSLLLKGFKWTDESLEPHSFTSFVSVSTFSLVELSVHNRKTPVCEVSTSTATFVQKCGEKNK